jgi:UDP-2-acetamido-3-amino-2,3-dideoxy-glucuronate N-acetyltransferase
MSRDPSVYVHERALCESDEVGPRTRVWALAQVMKGARVGADCNICGHAFIESGAVIGNGVTVKNAVLVWDRVTVEDVVFLGPNVVFTNDLNPRAEVKKGASQLVPTLVKRGASIGANATIVCGITIGSYSFIGAGAVVTRNVPDFALVMGNPARRTGWMCACGLKLDHNLACACGRRYAQSHEGAGLKPI